jgi:hypothetical protein
MSERSGRTKRIARTISRCTLALGAAILSACAPDAVGPGPSPGYSQFLDLISKACYPKSIGGAQISALVMNQSAFFLDTTSKLYFGKIGPEAYRANITAFTDSGRQTQQAIDCILEHLPAGRGQN